MFVNTLALVVSVAPVTPIGAQERTQERNRGNEAAEAVLSAQRAAAAESILAATEQARGESFDAAIRAGLMSRMETLSLEQLASLAQQGADADIPLALGSVTSDLVYTPVTPCRVFDSRVSQGGPGPIAANTQRNVFVAGAVANFAVQGGTVGGCGVPIGATSAIVNFVTVLPAGPGNIRAWAVANPQPAAPLAAVLNYGVVSGLAAIANGIAVPLCNPAATSCTLGDLRLQADTNATDILGDVVGYFRNPAATARGATSFSFVTVPADGAGPTTAATLTITPTVTGTMRYTARGFCNLAQVATSVEIRIYIGTSSADTGSVSDWGVMRFAGTATTLGIPWSATRDLTGTAGLALTASVFLQNAPGTTDNNCSGTFSAQQLLP